MYLESLLTLSEEKSPEMREVISTHRTFIFREFSISPPPSPKGQYFHSEPPSPKETAGSSGSYQNQNLLYLHLLLVEYPLKLLLKINH